MQRIKTFLVVCISILFAGKGFGQTAFPGPKKIIPSHLALSLVPQENGGNGGRWQAAGGGFRPAMEGDGGGYGALVGDIEGGLRLSGRLGGPYGLLRAQAATSGAAAGVGALRLSVGILPVQGLANDYYTCHFGFFCKKELDRKSVV